LFAANQYKGWIMPIQSCAMTTNIKQIAELDLQCGRLQRLTLASRRRKTDFVLARAAARGSMTALGELYARHNRRVYGVCLGMMHNSAEAEDLTQEVFIHLLRKIGSFRGESRFTTWLHRLTVNLVLMHFRRRVRQRHEAVDDLEGILSSLQRSRQSVSAQIADRIALDSALEQLSAGCRSVFLLFDVEGYKHDEIAHLLGCSAGTSKSQLHRARIKLRRLLAGRDENATVLVRAAKQETGRSVTALLSGDRSSILLIPGRGMTKRRQLSAPQS
jgi:RNA polymerase sigma-70 factor (ECF subfamily)